MKKHGVLNRDIARILASLGHTDQIVIADCGLPIPEDVECIDVSLKQGVPSFVEVLAEILADMEVEGLIAAEEVKEQNPAVHRALTGTNIPIHYLPHEQFKDTTCKAKAVIRTGEVTPYANVILRSGVIF
ncbi:D-ribose pyranase [Halalkalibacterium halodurans]|uniref:D-ribose pyranase n=1 Tax=Halalkalibacterium halodurans (strain ATCC BAA-125 / DSM 18197 / FERM 7344 / JCM 9153 / C-125) TaxID=272558 RepID=RBSD_HALH5|nr:D-ribose pyranase [Halalkalibacterium halodurans]Q9K6K0.1 RecName: Full=D-ribose pyranase [Halalkalibacterium halodurans C-125]MDY7224234.1 D-ribose pyranase [Halalkalibacterium halodurans]MDY7243519.1 D-ribose pyranase [Halalkalibacterium halodurans]MED4079829.1 D-ribose pyranase [Halalkalibacterium halodurans]MED4083745.1 D-ribose pyranase [Halalkalibacterium halodurans]MED4106566.1 D-ribose pyranase [Halalkalibacterium halodurans]